MHLLQHQGGIDFREYKPATVMRRIERRMQVRHVPDLDNYARLLDGDRTELNALRRELLIPVTSFFRDPAAFEVLAQTAIDTIVKERGENQPIRVWVPAPPPARRPTPSPSCSPRPSSAARRWPPLKLFATDVEQHNVDFGSAGVFSEAITTEVSPERLEQWFYKRGNHFVIKNEIRQNIVFARHNLLEDPPFTRMDLVSCRNLLIYFRSEAQERALRRLQYALAPGGFLFLGSSETLASCRPTSPRSTPSTRSSASCATWRCRWTPLALGRGAASTPRTPHAPGPRAGPALTDAAAIDAGQSVLLRSYAPTSLLLNANQELLHVFGDVSHYLRIGEGAVTLDLSKLLPPTLAPVAQALLHKTARGQEPLRSDVLSMERCRTASTERLRLVARSVELEQGEPHLLLSFEPEPAPVEGTSTPCRGIETMNMDHETRSGCRPWSASWPPPARACRPPSRSWRPPTRSCRPPTRS
jgi:two-component system CheB/CheR fusion protein